MDQRRVVDPDIPGDVAHPEPFESDREQAVDRR